MLETSKVGMYHMYKVSLQSKQNTRSRSLHKLSYSLQSERADNSAHDDLFQTKDMSETSTHHADCVFIVLSKPFQSNHYFEQFLNFTRIDIQRLTGRLW